MKIVVFDLDETLGYFVEFGIFWDSLSLYLNKELNQQDFNNLMDLYPEFLRPNIINILNYLKNKKITTNCQKIMIYTNNQGSRKWTNHIISYFESKINYYKLFDQLICAFKINGKQVEFCRTTNNKTYKDFIRCTKLPMNAEICYLDDSFYPEMVNDNIYYINIKPYTHCIPFDEICKRFLESNSLLSKKENNDDFKDFINKQIKMYNFSVIQKTKQDYEIDKILSKKIMIHLEDFFNKNNYSNKNKTCKKYHTYNKIKNKSSKNNKK
uniref:Uncharacterized protein n=1 Tax=viral metagenome TaxID=1070528 RepID=A0A6C0D6U0_9ZZZZ